MKKLALLLCLSASVWARTADTLYYRAVLLPSNEVPAATLDASGAATVRVHVVRDDAGLVLEGSVDFVASYAFPGPVTIVGMHIHSAEAGLAGGIVVDSGISALQPVTDSTGRGTLELQSQVRPDDQPGVAALRGILNNPAAYYVNIHTTDFPFGAIRGQLQRADTVVFMGLMSPLNEVPAITDYNASATSSVLVITTRDAAGKPTSAQMVFDANYRFPGQVTFTGFHIHGGPAGVNAGVIFNTGIGAGAASVTSDPSGAGNLHRPVEVNLAQAAQADALAGLLANPDNYYINLHTTEYGGGIVRSQLRSTDTMSFPVTMLPANEIPAVLLDASAVARITVHTLRYGDGSVQAGTADFDVNYRFPGAVEMTGLHIHDGVATVNGGVTVNSGLSAANSLKSDTGIGNIYRSVTVGDGVGVATLDSLVRNPENHYVNLHTTISPGGVMRSQLAPAVTIPAGIFSALSGNLDKNATTLAPGGLVSIFGTNLAKVAADLSGWKGASLPDYFNGVAVTVGGQRARLLYVSPGQINAQLAFETPTGKQGLAVNNGNGPGFPLTVTVAPVAPALFFNSAGVIALKNVNFSLVGPDNPARTDDTVILYATGLGQTTPALASGALPPASPLSNTDTAAVTIGGTSAVVVYSIASPGFAGLYQVAVKIPGGLAAGSVPVVLSIGQAASAPMMLSVKP